MWTRNCHKKCFGDKMKEVTKSYLAGFFDGEGCISITKNKKRNHYNLVVTVSGTKPKIISMFEQFFGGNVRIKLKNFPRQQVWIWNVYGEERREFLQIINPYLILKKEEALLGLKYSMYLHKYGLQDIREEFRLQMSSLK